MQQVKAGLKAIYLSGWQVAATPTATARCTPTSRCTRSTRCRKVVKRSTTPSSAPTRSSGAKARDDIDYFAPIVADAEAGFGGVLNAFELMKAMIEAGAAGVHFEDQLAAVKKCGHMGGKVLVPTREAVAKLVAARLAADVMGTPTILLARTDAEAADLVTSDVDDNDKPFCTGERTVEGFYRTRNGLDQADQPRPGLRAVRRPDLVRDRQARPGLREGLRRRDPRQVPGQAAGLQLLAELQLEEEPRRRDDRQVPARARRDGLQVPVHHAGRLPQPELLDVRPGHGYARNNMSAFVELQESEFAAAEKGFTAVKHQREVGTGYFDAVTTTIERERRPRR
jgi:isocitrate lyase